MHNGKLPLQDCKFEAYYSILKGSDSATYASPVDGFINIMLVDGDGACTYFLKGRQHLVRCGENFLHAVHEGSLLEWRSPSMDSVAILLFIPEAMLGDYLVSSGGQSLEEDRIMTKSDQRLDLIIRQMVDLSFQPGHLAGLRIQSLIIEALVYQVQDLYQQVDSPETLVNKAHYDKVLLAKQLIEKDVSKTYTIHELAKAVGTNEQYLKKHFKQYIGKTVMSYMTEVKMEHAKNLITSGEYRIADVAQMTGYKHPTHFTTAFKKFFGFIPNSLRYTLLMAQGGAQLWQECHKAIEIL